MKGANNLMSKFYFPKLRDEYFLAYNDKKIGRVMWKCKCCWKPFYALSPTDISAFLDHIHYECDKMVFNTIEAITDAINHDYGKE
jgi:hypothetical protein